MDFKQTNASIKWTFDKLIKELSKPEYNVELKLMVDMPKDNELHFILITRNTPREKTILADCAKAFYGYIKKKTTKLLKSDK